MFAALKSWAVALHPDSEWSPDLKIAIGSENKPIVSFAPALVMRKRNQVGMVRIYDALIDRLSRDTEVAPSGWIGLVDDEDDQDQTEQRLPAADALLGQRRLRFARPWFRRRARHQIRSLRPRAGRRP